jgi:hypothetical protein
MKLSFQPVTLGLQAAYRERYDKTPELASDYTFVNLWGYAEAYGLEVAFCDELVWIRQNRPMTCFWAPVGPWDKVDWSDCIDCLPEGKTFIRVPRSLAKAWRDGLGADPVPDRDNWDYVYLVPELVNLPDRRFAKKRALLEEFKDKYDWHYQEMGPDCVEQALELQDHWCHWRDCEANGTLEKENEAIHRTLQHWDDIGCLTGGALHVNGRMAAYTVAEALNADTAVIHFEKGDTSFTGVYQAVNQMFLENSGGNYTWVNREQDLGDEGIRKAKLSYNPADFLEKYTVRF